MATYWINKLKKDGWIAATIVVLPFTLYLHTFFPEKAGSIHILGFVFEYNFSSSDWLVWSYLTRIIILILLLIWRLTTYFWWKNVVYIPFTLYLYQLFKISFLSDYTFSNSEHIISLLASILIVLFLAFNGRRSDKKDSRIHDNPLLSQFINFKTLYDQLSHQKITIKKLVAHTPSIEILRMLELVKTTLESKLRIVFDTTAGRSQKHIFTDYLVVSFLMVFPFLNYIFTLFPEGPERIQIGWFTLTSHGFYDVRLFVWYFCFKFWMILLLCIWFITNPYWWKYALFSPIALMTYQLFEGIRNQSSKIDEFEYVEVLPIVVIVAAALVFIAKQIKYQSYAMDLYDSISREIEQLLRQLAITDKTIADKETAFAQLKKKSMNEASALKNLRCLEALRKELALAVQDRTN